jgi:hypothetical protein
VVDSTKAYPKRWISIAHARSGVPELRRFDHLHNLAHVKLRPGKSIAEVLAAYRADPGVKYARANYSRSRTTPNALDLDCGGLPGSAGRYNRG